VAVAPPALPSSAHRRALLLPLAAWLWLAGGCGGGAWAPDPGPDRRDVGFGVTVNLAARTGGLPGGARFRWEQVGGPDVTESMRGADSPNLAFVTRTLEQLGVLEDRPHVVAFSPYTAGEYRFRLSVEAGGQVRRREVLVTSTARHGGVSGIPLGVPTWLSVPAKGPYAWRVVTAPRGSRATMEPAGARAARLLPDVIGQYIVEETGAQVQFNLYAGRWADVPKDCARTSCHPTQGTGFPRTRHATVMTRGLKGELRGRGAYRRECLRCHATGWDDTVDNGGFDDEARRVGWALPTTPNPRPKALPGPLRGLANITCLSCHGPGKLNYSSLALGRSVAWGIGQCAVCHDAPPEYNHVAEWRRSPMNVRVDRGPGPATTPGCAACHSAHGFISSLRGEPKAAPGVLRAEPVTCPACHDPHQAKHPAQLRLAAADLCGRCHRADGRGGLAPSPFPAPHAPQAEVLAGTGAKALAGAPLPTGGPHARVPGGCVRCHAARQAAAGPLRVGGHTFRARDGDAENLAACGGHCHPGRERFDLRAREDFDGDGVVETNRQEIDGLLEALRAALGAELARRGLAACGGAAAGVGTTQGHLVLVDVKGGDLGDCDRDGKLAGAERPAVLPAAAADLYPVAYNYLLVRRDASHGLHNLPFAVAVLQRSLTALRPRTTPAPRAASAR
jgi:predicted CXXCH cytochrome family protein